MTAYARQASKANPLYAQLAAGTSKNAYNLALSDWYNPPVIHEVTVQDGLICVDATDNVLVSKVLITISDEQGDILEQGEAALTSGTSWEYKMAVPGDLLVEACDPAGNRTRRQMLLRAK